MDRRGHDRWRGLSCHRHRAGRDAANSEVDREEFSGGIESSCGRAQRKRQSLRGGQSLQAGAVILALDTTTELGSIGLVQGERVIEEVPLHSPDGFWQILFGHIVMLLANPGTSLDQIDVFSSSSGPMSFLVVALGPT